MALIQKSWIVGFDKEECISLLLGKEVQQFLDDKNVSQSISKTDKIYCTEPFSYMIRSRHCLEFSFHPSSTQQVSDASSPTGNTVFGLSGAWVERAEG